MNVQQIIDELNSLSNPDHRKSLSHFGVEAHHALGITLPQLRALAKRIGKNHELALQLWEEPIHEAKIITTLIADPKQITPSQIDTMVNGFYSWDVTDQACTNVFRKIKEPFSLVDQYVHYEGEFQRRTGFTMIAVLGVHAKKEPDTTFLKCIEYIEQYAFDDRNFVKKAVSWGLRQIGKRSLSLHPTAIAAAERIHQQDSVAARWIASDVLRELQSDKVITKLNAKKN